MTPLIRVSLIEFEFDEWLLNVGVCYRDCFKQPIRKYVEFCLEKRCNNANFEDAAKFMGYLK
jgi:hypothetical protein